MKTSLYHVLTGAFLIMTSILSAQPPGATRPSPWSVGAIMLTDSQPYKDAGGIVRAFPSVVYRGERLQVLGPLVRYKLFQNDWITLHGNLAVEFSPYEEDDSFILEGLDEPDTTLIAGVSGRLSLAELNLPNWSLNFTAEGDVLGEHDGFQVTAGGNYAFGSPWAPFSGGLGAGVLLQDENWTNYFVGVPEDKETAERQAYEASSSVNPYVTLRLMYLINRNWSVMGLARLEWLDESWTDSSIVADDTRTVTFVSLNYTF